MKTLEIDLGKKTIMKTMLKTVLTTGGLVLACAWTSQAAIIANWTFENFPDPSPGAPVVTAGPHSPEVGSGSALGSHASGATVYTSPAGNGSVNSFSANTWAVNDYWQFQVSTLGYTGISIQWDQTGSGTGPRDFALLYSLNGTTFLPVNGFSGVNTYQVLNNGSPNLSWSVANGVQSAYTYTPTLTSIAASIANQATVYFRLADNSTTSINGGAVGTAGTDRVDNFLVQGAVVPEPSTLIAGALLLLPFGARGLRYLRNQKLS